MIPSLFTFHNIPHYISELERYQPTLLAGYPSSIYLLALGNRRYGGPLRPRAIYTASETLFDSQRETIEESFGCKVFMWYGNSEMCANVVECEKGRYHLKSEHSYVEIVDGSGQHVSVGREGKMVCTGFGNYAMPLVRYSVEDIAVLSKEEVCGCGRGGKIIERIVGRTDDYIVTPDGRFVGRLGHMFKDSVHVKLAQIVQNEVDEVIIRIVKDGSYSTGDEDDILCETRLRLGSSIKIVFEYVDDIERTGTGKYRFIISNIQNKGVFDEAVTGHAVSWNS